MDKLKTCKPALCRVAQVCACAIGLLQQGQCGVPVPGVVGTVLFHLEIKCFVLWTFEKPAGSLKAL